MRSWRDRMASSSVQRCSVNQQLVFVRSVTTESDLPFLVATGFAFSFRRTSACTSVTRRKLDISLFSSQYACCTLPKQKCFQKVRELLPLKHPRAYQAAAAKESLLPDGHYQFYRSPMIPSEFSHSDNYFKPTDLCIFGLLRITIYHAMFIN